MRLLSYVIILLGITVLATPKLMEWKADRELNELLREAEQVEAAIKPAADTDIIAGYMQLSRLFEEESHRLEEDAVSQPADLAPDSASNVGSVAAPIPTSVVAAQTTAAADKAKPQPIATIEIASIGVKLPVLAGATEANMTAAAAHMTETAQLGESGNAAIAAHRARTKGRLFNRLNEVEEGDEIVIRKGGQKYVYTVLWQMIVEPDDVSVLNNNGDDKLLTLITCDPVDTATHRLIVQARMD